MNTVDKYGDNVVDKIKGKSSDEYVSPYLQRPLRSFADVLADRRVLGVESDKLRSAETVFDRIPSSTAQSRGHH
jgi:hypothetical protein